MENVDAFADALGKAGKYAKDFVKSSVNGKKMNGTDKAINKIVSGIGNNAFGGFEALYSFTKNKGMSVGDALVKTFANDYETKTMDGVKRLVAKDGWNYKKIAGSYIGLATAGRIVSGGGVTKDGQGRPNIIGIPFV